MNITENKQTKIVIIGNSPSITNSKMGNEIDRFDIVIRLNNYVINGFEEYIGKKTDYVFVTFATKYNKELMQINKSKIYLFAAEHYNNMNFLKTRMNRTDAIQINPYDVNILPEYYFSLLNRKVGLLGNERCSIGLIAINWAIRNFINTCDIYTYGIDFFKGSTNVINHYFNHITPVDNFHNFAKEIAYFNKVIYKKIKQL